jgi:oligogalacturonide lyase
MKIMLQLLLALAAFALAGHAADEAVQSWIDPQSGHRVIQFPRSWIDPDTGHRVVQLSTEPGSACLYFTQYGFTAGGTKMVMIATQGNIDLVTLATGEIEHVYQGHGARVLQAGRKTGAIFYTKDGALYALDPATKQSRLVVKLPEHGNIAAINCDETLAAGTISATSGTRRSQAPSGQTQDQAPAARGSRPAYKPGDGIQLGDISLGKHPMMDRRLAEHVPTTLFTINLQTGEIKELLHGTDWIDHEQFSPTDPSLLMYAHEGRQWEIDRVWLIRADGKSQPMLVHQRTEKMEIAVHEYWSNDGQWIWYDLQKPLGEDYWVAGYNVTDGGRLWYHLPPDHWSTHYNTTPDGKLFSGDGSDPIGTDELGMALNAKWMFLFRPSLVPDMPDETADQQHMIQVGRFTAERLVNLSEHDYSIEPNGNFTPDGKWLVFRSNMRGPIQVYAVEIAKAQATPPTPQ